MAVSKNGGSFLWVFWPLLFGNSHVGLLEVFSGPLPLPGCRGDRAQVEAFGGQGLELGFSVVYLRPLKGESE